MIRLLVCWDGSTLKLVFSSAELMADRVQSRARPSSNGLALQSSGTGGSAMASAPAACPMMMALVVVTRTNISLKLRSLKNRILLFLKVINFFQCEFGSCQWGNDNIRLSGS